MNEYVRSWNVLLVCFLSLEFLSEPELLPRMPVAWTRPAVMRRGKTHTAPWWKIHGSWYGPCRFSIKWCHVGCCVAGGILAVITITVMFLFISCESSWAFDEASRVMGCTPKKAALPKTSPKHRWTSDGAFWRSKQAIAIHEIAGQNKTKWNPLFSHLKPIIKIIMKLTFL